MIWNRSGYSGGGSALHLIVWAVAAGVMWFWRWQYRRWGHGFGATVTTLMALAMLWTFLTSKYWADRIDQRTGFRIEQTDGGPNGNP